jgi:hypothetical protein
MHKNILFNMLLFVLNKEILFKNLALAVARYCLKIEKRILKNQ